LNGERSEIYKRRFGERGRGNLEELCLRNELGIVAAKQLRGRDLEK